MKKLLAFQNILELSSKELSTFVWNYIADNLIPDYDFACEALIAMGED